MAAKPTSGNQSAVHTHFCATFLLYPLSSDRPGFPVHPFENRAGMFLTIPAFSISGFIQMWIEAGQTPSIGWQVFAYALLTAAEVMVSITCLEFSYTQAPPSIKSIVMSCYLASVALGNEFTAVINAMIVGSRWIVASGSKLLLVFHWSHALCSDRICYVCRFDTVAEPTNLNQSETF